MPLRRGERTLKDQKRGGGIRVEPGRRGGYGVDIVGGAGRDAESDDNGKCLQAVTEKSAGVFSAAQPPRQRRAEDEARDRAKRREHQQRQNARRDRIGPVAETDQLQDQQGGDKAHDRADHPAGDLQRILHVFLDDQSQQTAIKAARFCRGWPAIRSPLSRLNAIFSDASGAIAPGLPASMPADDLRHLAGRRRVAAALGADDAVDDGHADAGEVAELHALQDVLAGRVLRLVHQDEIGGAADFDDAAVELAHAGGVAGRQAEGEFGGQVAERGQHRHHAQDAERLHAGAGRRIGAEDDAVEVAHLARGAQREQRRAFVAVVNQLQPALAALADAADLVVGQGGVAAIDMADHVGVGFQHHVLVDQAGAGDRRDRRCGSCSGCRTCAPSRPSSARSGRP